MLVGPLSCFTEDRNKIVCHTSSPDYNKLSCIFLETDLQWIFSGLFNQESFDEVCLELETVKSELSKVWRILEEKVQKRLKNLCQLQAFVRVSAIFKPTEILCCRCENKSTHKSSC